MTEAYEANDIDGPHEGPIKTPKQLILAVLFAFVIPIFGIVLLVMFVAAERRPAAGSDAFTPKAIAERIRPVGIVEVKDITDIASLKTGEQVFAAQCAACHAAGALGAPKMGDADAWAPRIKSGYDALLHSSLAGKGQMPPQGGGDFTDFEIARAVVFMADRSGARFPEPQPPAPGASNAAATTAGAAAGATTVAAAGTAAAAGVTPAATSPRADSNAGTPIATPSAALNAQVRSAAPNATPGNAAAQNTFAAETPGATAAAATTGATTTMAATPAAAGAVPAIYTQTCAVCHAAGVAGAPKLGDKAAWQPRVAQGVDALTAIAIKGKGAMPPKGGSTASDAEIKGVVTYMVNASK